MYNVRALILKLLNWSIWKKIKANYNVQSKQCQTMNFSKLCPILVKGRWILYKWISMIETSLQHTISQINNSYDQTNGKSGYALWQPNRTQFQCNYWGWRMDREGQPLKPGAYYKSLKYIFPPFSPSQHFIHYKTTQFRSYRVLLLCNKYIMHEKSTPSL